MSQSLKERFKTIYEYQLTERELETLCRVELSDRKTEKGEYVFHVRREEDMDDIRKNRRLLQCLRETAEFLNDDRTVIYRRGKSAEKRITERTEATEGTSLSKIYGRKGKSETDIQTATIEKGASHLTMRVSREQLMVNAAAVTCAIKGAEKMKIPFSAIENSESNYTRVRREAAKAETAETEVNIRTRHRDGRQTTTKTTLTIIRSVEERTEKGRKYLIVEPTVKTREIMKGRGEMAGLRKPLANLTDPLLPKLTGKARSLLLAVMNASPEGITADPDKIKGILGETAQYRDWSDYKKRLIACPAKEIEKKSKGKYRIAFKATRVKGLRYEALPVEISIWKADTREETT